MKNQKGFTLIELVVVIVILGILAAVAAPKFIDISSDARIATLEGAEAAIKSGNALVNAKALVAGVENNEGATIVIDGANVTIDYGYVQATEVGIGVVLDDALDGNGDWDTVEKTAGSVIKVFPADLTVTADDTNGTVCYLEYTEATDTDKPQYNIVSTGC